MLPTLLYVHVAAVLCLMMFDATLAMMFNKRYRLFKSMVKRTLWPLYAIFYLLAVYLITNGNKRAGELFQRIR